MSHKNFWRKINAQIDDRVLRIMAGRSHKIIFISIRYKKDPIFRNSIVPLFHILIITILLGLVACAPRIKEPVGSDKAAKGTALYEQAEKLYKAKAYGDALKLYNEYLIKYPDLSLADESF